MKTITKNKTSELIVLAHNKTKLIVCHSMEEEHRIFDQAMTMGLKIHLPIIGFTYREFLQGRYTTTFTESVLIDNVDMLVQYISKVPVEAITLSAEE